jgi:hypothetical protein
MTTPRLSEQAAPASTATKGPEAAWLTGARLLLGGLMAWGGGMHFTVDQRVWKSPLIDALAESGYMWREIGIVNILCGVCLVLNRWSALAAAALLPITLNIFLLHLWRLDAFGLTIGVPVFALNLVLLYGLRAKYERLTARS